MDVVDARETFLLRIFCGACGGPATLHCRQLKDRDTRVWTCPHCRAEMIVRLAGAINAVGAGHEN